MKGLKLTARGHAVVESVGAVAMVASFIASLWLVF